MSAIRPSLMVSCVRDLADVT